MAPFDIVTFGETMIRLSPPLNQTLEQTATLDVGIGGSESNTAIAASRLGLRTAWISKLANNPLGRKIASSIATHGVDVSGVVWSADGRNATYFIEFGKPPRSHRVTYDRKNSAINTLKPSEVDWSLIKGAGIVHSTGITAALSNNCRRLLEDFFVRSRKQRSLISFDVNYRAKLWNPARARRALSSLLPGVDILFVNADDATGVLGAKGPPDEMVKSLASRFGCRTVVITMGKDGAICQHEHQIYRSRSFPTVEVDRVGAGDAFSAGFLFGYLTGDLEYALNFAAAISALKFTVPGDLAWLTKNDVEAVLDSSHFKIHR